MKGMLKTRPALSQLLLVISIAVVSTFVIGMIGIVILSNITGVSMKEMSDMASWDYSRPEVITILRGMQVSQFIGLFVVPAWICSKLFSTDSAAYLGFKKPSIPLYFVVGTAAILIALPFVNWIGALNQQVELPSGIAKWMHDKELEASKTIKALLSLRTPQDLIINIICIAGLAAVGEELLFRGVLQRLFIKMFKNHWTGIIVAALLFSAMHLQFYGFLPRFGLGIVLGLIYWYSGSLWVAILAHFVYDALLIVLAYNNPEMLRDDTTIKLADTALPAILSLVAVVALVIWMKRKSKTTYEGVYADDKIPVKDNPF